MAANPANPKVAHVCKYLRTKSLFTPDPRGNRALVEPSATATYWCNRSGTSIGPDNDFVGPKDCGSGRGCCVVVTVLLVDADDSD